MDGRFSKKQLAIWIGKKTKWMETEYGFHTQTGWAQVEGKGEKLNRLYGEYEQLQDLMHVFDLDWQSYWDARRS